MAEYPVFIETYTSQPYWQDISGTLADAEAFAIATATSGFVYTETLPNATPSGDYTKVIPNKEIRKVTVFPEK